ncbi:hypothetical protein H0H81_000709 [Sphagnurus paluster]|uniref:Uncharacterized protein n=1 Tax=Sphagnurus paluster TaxID=117069 RepID=A0A9P7KFB8_9AGAR|nr:hypothetical protein H0H81_000709 [Sphagnurus paluster]
MFGFIPDVVAEHLVKHNIDLVPMQAAPSEDLKTDGHVWYIPPAIRQAVLDKDGAKIQAGRNNHVHDLKANMDAIHKVGEDAFLSVTDSTTKQRYRLCSSDDGWMWTYTQKLEHVNAKIKATVCVGSFSKNAKWMGLSVNTLSNMPTSITDFIVNGVVSRLIGKFISKRLGGMAYKAALTAAEEAATEGLESASMMFPEWAISAAGFVGGLVGGMVVGIVLLYLINYLHQEFGLEINVFNWSTEEEWDVVEWHGDNAVMQNSDGKTDPFKQDNLEAVTSKLIKWSVLAFYNDQHSYFSDVIKLPTGFAISDDSVASYATYILENNSKTAQGLGAGFKVVSKSDSSRVIYLKYVVHWGAPKNEIGLQDGQQSTSLTSFYNGGWASKGSKDVSITIPASGKLPATPVIGLTPALEGDENHYYHYDVHIGATKKTSK